MTSHCSGTSTGTSSTINEKQKTCCSMEQHFVVVLYLSCCWYDGWYQMFNVLTEMCVDNTAVNHLRTKLFCENTESWVDICVRLIRGRQDPGLLFARRWDVVPPNLLKSRSRELSCCNDRSVLKFDRHLGSAAAEVLAKFQSDWKNVKSRLRDFTRFCGKTSVRLVNRAPFYST